MAPGGRENRSSLEMQIYADGVVDEGDAERFYSCGINLVRHLLVEHSGRLMCQAPIGWC